MKKESKSKISIHSPKKSSERKEAWMRIVVLIVSGIVLWAWAYFIIVLGIINFFYTIFIAKRMKNLAEMSEIWNTQKYIFQRYMIFESNFRPFPFTKLQESMSKFQ
ncbi:MAG: DUF4389 domain-containing protein [Nanoarchaeota archaeon]